MHMKDFLVNVKTKAKLKATRITDAQVEAVFDVVFEEILLAMKAGEKLCIRGFGTFGSRKTKAVERFSPRTREAVFVGPKLRAHLRWAATTKVLQDLEDEQVAEAS